VRPGAAPAGSGEYLEPMHRLGLGFVRKLSVRHVSDRQDRLMTGQSPISGQR
jgi:hypothetical protein